MQTVAAPQNGMACGSFVNADVGSWRAASDEGNTPEHTAWIYRCS
jgi:hypothetical protein